MSAPILHHRRRLMVPLSATPPNSAVFHQNKQLKNLDSELSLSIAFVCERRLFGHAYRHLQSDYFDDMPLGSGVALGIAVPTRLISSEIQRPGDIDLIVLPYHGADLILDRMLAVEVKVVRASYLRQGKSPNDFGFTQALALQELGFPFVAVVYLIVSDQSPVDVWQWTGIARVIDHTGRVEMLPREKHDLLPATLIERNFGRLVANAPVQDVGLASVYVDQPMLTPQGFYVPGPNVWMPLGRQARRNTRYDPGLMEKIADLFLANRRHLLVTPRYDPPHN